MKLKNILVPVLLASAVIAYVGYAMRKASEGPTPVDQESLARNAAYQSEMQDIEQRGNIRMVELSLGDIAASQIKICYNAGYPHNRGTYNGLSRREVAECDAILKQVSKLEAQVAAEKAKKDAAYDKAHPVQ